VARAPSPADFLELLERSRRGRLKLYIGFAAGVGKTYRMLEEAHALRRRGTDVVVALVETHGRADVAALLPGLEIVPRRKLEYRGLHVEEMDLDAVIARRPEIAIVDEIAHTNVPGSRNAKRYQDVLELLRTGIHVIGAFNVQHLESLNDLVERSTGTLVRERVPDTFLEQADQVVNLDLAVEDLLERLRAGKIYPPARSEQALRAFFRPENLTTLRELALREVAESVGRTPASAPEAGARARARRAASGRVLVCLSSLSPRAPSLIRSGARLAGRLNTDWFTAYVETPAEAPDRVDAATLRRLHANIERARELGAEVVCLRACDPVAAILDFARSHAVAHIVVGRTRRTGWKRLLRGDFMHRMVREAMDFDLHVVATPDEEATP
jgi:two-component system, OmpR family, sensor histidine kinase KdpD